MPLTIDTTDDSTATPSIELRPCPTCGTADPYIHLHGQSRLINAEGLGLRYRNNVGDAFIYTGHNSVDSQIRFWTKGEPLPYNSATTGGERLVIGDTSVTTGVDVDLLSGGHVSTAVGKLFFMGGHAGGCMGMAYNAANPGYGVFYQEGTPDAIHLSPNGAGCGQSSPLVATEQLVTINPSLRVDSTSTSATPSIELRPCPTCGTADPYIHLHGQSRLINAEGLGLRYRNNVGDAFIYTGHNSVDSQIRFWTKGEPLPYNSATTGGERLVIGDTSVTTGVDVDLLSGGHVSTAVGKLFFMGGHAGGCMGMAYNAANPGYGVFYQEGTPDAIHLSPNGAGCSGSAMSIEGSGTVKVGGSIVHGSDRRLKTIGGPFPYGLSHIEKLEPVLYSYKAGNARGLESTKEFAGFIAQDVLAAGISHAVHLDAKDGMYNLDTQPIVASLVAAVKELKETVDQLGAANRLMAAEVATVKELKQIVGDLSAFNRELVAELAQLRAKSQPMRGASGIVEGIADE